MKYFRAPELAIWAAVVAAMAAVVVFALTHVGPAEVAASHAQLLSGAVPAASVSAARPYSDALTALMPVGVSAGASGANLSRWAAQVGSVAVQGAGTRQSEGAGSDDPMLASFTRVAGLAATLTGATPAVAGASTRTQIGLVSDRLVSLAAGLPVAPLSDWAAPGAGTGPSSPGPVAGPNRPSVPVPAHQPLPAPARPTLEVHP